MKKRSGCVIRSFLIHLPYGVDPVLGFEWVSLLRVDQDRTVHLLHLLFSVLVGLYFTALWLFACHG